MKTPAPASNEEIERRISDEVKSIVYDICKLESEDQHYETIKIFAKAAARHGIRFGLQLSSELKAQKPIDHAECTLDCEFDCHGVKQIDDSLELRANAYQNERYKNEHDIDYYGVSTCFEAGALSQAPISEAIGEAKGIKWAIETLDTCNCQDYLKEEAKRRGILK